MKHFINQILGHVLFPLAMCLMIISAGCGSKTQWEYRTYIVYGQVQTDYYPDFRSKTAIPDYEEMNKLGEEGWELVSSYELLETAFPNMGRQDVVLGIKPNVRTGSVAFVFKRLRQKDAVADSDSVKYDILAIDPVAAKNKKAGAEFLEKKAKEPGYKKTASGIVYKVIKEGSGPNFTKEDIISLSRKVTKIDGTLHYESTEPIERNIEELPPGYGEVLGMMNPGMKIEAIIPGNLTGSDDGFEPNETVIYEIETFSAKPKEKK